MTKKSKIRRVYTPEFREQILAQIDGAYGSQVRTARAAGLHPGLVNQWRRQAKLRLSNPVSNT